MSHGLTSSACLVPDNGLRPCASAARTVNAVPTADEQLDRRRAAWMAAAQAGDRIAYEHWIWKLLYFPIVGVAWILPLKPLLKWMHAKDGPSESPDV